MSKNTQISELINYISVDGSGNIVFTTVPAASSNTDKFLVSDAGVLKFRTAAQLLSDIGAQASGSYQAALSGTGFVKISGTTISYDDSTYLTTSSAGTTYVPYTGATSSLDVGTNDLSGRYLNANGSAGLGGVLHLRQDAAYLARGNGYSTIASSGTLFQFFAYTGASTYKDFALRYDGLTNNTTRIYTLPDASGTLALTSDIPSVSGVYLPLAGGTLTGTSASTVLSLANSTGGTKADFTITENVGLIINSYEGGTARSIDLRVGGVSALSIAAGGAATFSNILNIGYDSNNRSTIRLTSNAANRQAAIYFYGNNTESAALGYEGGSEVVGGGVQGDFVIRNVLANKHIILATNNGNVGIGTLIPTGKLMIEATGNHLFLRASSATAGKYWNFDVTSANQLYIVNNAGSQYLTILDGGNTGLGVVAPSYKLDVSGRIRAFTGSSGVSPRTDLGGTIIAEGGTRAGLYILTTGTASGSYGSIWWGNGNTNTDAFISVENDTRAMRFGTADGTRMSILSGGNVGVNTPDPLEKFSVTGNAHIAGVGNALYFDTDGSGRAIAQYVSNLYEFNIVNGRGNSAKFVLGNGSISLGTTATAQFFINTSSGAASFSSSISAGGTISGSLFQTSETNVSGVSTSFVNSGTSFTNTTGIWLVSVTGSGDGNMYSAVSYIVTTAAYSKTINLVAGPSNHFGNGSLVAQLSTNDGFSAELQVRRTTSGTASVSVRTMRIA